jgi:hypothetical protein
VDQAGRKRQVVDGYGNKKDELAVTALSFWAETGAGERLEFGEAAVRIRRFLAPAAQ